MAERYIPEHRRTQFKARNQFRPDELRRRREEQQVEIRKQKRDENLAKRRGIQTRDGGIGVGGGVAAESDDEASAIESEVCSSCISFLFVSHCSISLFLSRPGAGPIGCPFSNLSFWSLLLVQMRPSESFSPLCRRASPHSALTGQAHDQHHEDSLRAQPRCIHYCAK